MSPVQHLVSISIQEFEDILVFYSCMILACRWDPLEGMDCISDLLDFSLQVSQLDALLKVPAVLLSCQVQFLLLLMEKLQQVLNPRSHVDVSITQQLNT